MTDHSNMKLGKKMARHDPRTLLLANYLTPSDLPPIPDGKDWSGPVPTWGMMRNDAIGDCTCAAAGHLIMSWTANASTERTVPDAAILTAYEAISGYDPATGANDNGAVEIDVLNYWRTTGVGDDQITAYVALEPANHQHIKAGVYLFGGCYIGVALPISAQKQTVWSVPPGGPVGPGQPGSWGGHAVPVVAYDAYGLTVVTWGALKRMTWSFWEAYCDEAYAILSQDFRTASGTAPTGIDFQALQQDLQAVTG